MVLVLLEQKARHEAEPGGVAEVAKELCAIVRHVCVRRLARLLRAVFPRLVSGVEVYERAARATRDGV